MPYELEKSGSKYYVVNKTTGKRNSKKPMPKFIALKQMKALYAAETSTEKDFTVMKQADGRYRWVLFSSNAFQDRAGEIVSTKALEDDVELTDKTGDYGPLRWWHVGKFEFVDAKDYKTYTAGPGLDIGDCDFRMVQGKMLIESGTFRDEAIGEAIAPIADQLQASIRFSHPSQQPDSDGVFTSIKSLERSLLPKGKACNRFTKLIVKESDMTTAKEKVDKFVSLLGEAAKGILSQADIVEKEIETQCIASKETPDAAAVDEKAKSTTPGDYLVVEKSGDGKADVLHLQVSTDGKPDHKLMGAAHAALMSPKGFRGQLYAGPEKDKAITKLKAMYKAESMDWPEDKTASAKEFSFGDVTNALYEALHEAFPKDDGTPDFGFGVQDVFSNWFVYTNWNTGQYWRDTYTLDEVGEATLSGTPVEVTKHTVYIPATEELTTTPKVDLGPVITGMKELRDLLTVEVTAKDDTVAAVKEAQEGQLKRIQELEAQLQTTSKELDELKGTQPRGVKELQGLRASQSESTVIPDGSKLSSKENNAGPHLDPSFMGFATGQNQSQ